MSTPGAIIFDFDGVLLESEFEGNRELAELLTELGFPTTVDDALTHYIGLAGEQFIGAVESRIGSALPPEFKLRRREQRDRALREGVRAVTGAVAFVRDLPSSVPKAVASSSYTRWIRPHLANMGLADAFGDHVYSGAEHVQRGKPAPDLYLYAADQLGVPISDCVVIEDSEVGAIGAVASGAQVIGLAAGAHCLAGHADKLRAVGVREVAGSFDDVRALLGLE